LQESVSMLEDLAAQALQAGFEVHLGKTNILNSYNKSFQAKGEKIDTETLLANSYQFCLKANRWIIWADG